MVKMLFPKLRMIEVMMKLNKKLNALEKLLAHMSLWKAH